MLVIVKNGVDTPEGKRGIRLATDMGADLALIQNGVYFAVGGGLDGFSGTLYVLDEDCRLRGLKDDEIAKGLKKLDYDGLVDVITQSDKVLGML